MRSPKVSIIIISYNKADELKNAIQSILDSCNDLSYEIIVVDNASKDANVEMLKKNFPDISLIENKANLGFAKACNIGAKKSAGKYIVIMNSDIILKGNPFKEMLEVYEECVDAGIVGYQLLNEDGSLQQSYYNFPSLSKRFIELIGLKKILRPFYTTTKLKKEKIFPVQVVKGALMMIEKNFFFRIKGFDEYYFMYVEDIDISLQSLRSGKKNYIVNGRNVVHLGWHVAAFENEFVFFNLNEGLIYFYRKNHSYPKYIIFMISNMLFIKLRYFSFFLRKNSNGKRMLYQLYKLYKREF